MASTDGLKQRIESFSRELAAEFGDVDDSMGDCWLDAVENQAVELGDAISTELVRQMSLRGEVPQQAACPECNTAGHYKGQRERELIGRRGPVTITESEYFCPACRRAFFPADRSDRR